MLEHSDGFDSAEFSHIVIDIEKLGNVSVIIAGTNPLGPVVRSPDKLSTG